MKWTLLKDLPGAKAGTVGVNGCHSENLFNFGDHIFEIYQMQKYPDFFKCDEEIIDKPKRMWDEYKWIDIIEDIAVTTEEAEEMKRFIDNACADAVREFAKRIRPIVSIGPYPKDEWINTLVVHLAIDKELKRLGIKEIKP